MKTKDLTVKSVVEAKPLLHFCDDENCWCRPEVLQVCTECEEVVNPNCWACGGRGLVPAYDPSEPAIIVHRDL